MNNHFTRNPWAPMISFWCLLWQRQLELSLQHMARMGGAVPRVRAADLSETADKAAKLARAPRAKPKRTAA
jgi:hypothetical protein